MAASIYGYLETQAHDLDRLYVSPWCSLAVFQSLDVLSKQLVLRLLFLKGAVVAYAYLEQWTKPTPAVRRELRECVDRLLRLRILGSPDASTANAGGGGGAWRAQDMNGTVDTREPLIINGLFAVALQAALTTVAATPWFEETAALPALRSPPSAAEIEAHAAHRWNAVLHFLVGTADAPTPDNKVIELLVSTRLLAPGASAADEMLFDAEGQAMGIGAEAAESGGVGAATAAQLRGTPLSFDEIMELGGGQVHITRGGYEFLLKDTAVQLWTFVDEYLRTAVGRGMRTADILAFLFELGYCLPGHGYALAALTPLQVSIVEDFMSFGLVYVPSDQELVELDAGDDDEGSRGGDTRRFFPTSLAVVLTRAAPAGGAGQRGGHSVAPAAVDPSAPAAAAPPRAVASAGDVLQLIVERNFKIYAYTVVDLHLALLALFAKVEVRLPNLVVATLTRRSVLGAMEKGISAAQIRRFLAAHAHAAARSAEGGGGGGGGDVPENVVDQLHLWEKERHRVTFRPGVLFTSFEAPQLFRGAVDALLRVDGALLLADEAAQAIVVAERHAEATKAIIRSLRDAAAA